MRVRKVLPATLAGVALLAISGCAIAGPTNTIMSEEGESAAVASAQPVEQPVAIASSDLTLMGFPEDGADTSNWGAEVRLPASAGGMNDYTSISGTAPEGMAAGTPLSVWWVRSDGTFAKLETVRSKIDSDGTFQVMFQPGAQGSLGYAIGSEDPSIPSAKVFKFQFEGVVG